MMKLEVKERDKTVIRLHIPQFFIKSKLFAKMLLKGKKAEEKDIEEMQNFFRIVYKYLKKQTKALGHFTFLEVESAGDSVTISF